MPDHSEDTFYLIDHNGFRRVPRIVRARDGRYGFAIHPIGEGNNNSAAYFTTDLKLMVQEVVLRGKGVRARAKGGPQDGQQNTIGLTDKAIRGYWLHPDHLDWVKGGVQPEAQVHMTAASANPVPSLPMAAKPVDSARAPAPEQKPLVAQHGSFQTIESINFADHCCQGKGKIEPGNFSLDDLTMVSEGDKHLRFSPLGNRPKHPLVALVGITPGAQIHKFARFLATMDVSAAASKAAFAGAQTVIKQILLAHGLARHIGVSLDGDLNDNNEILTTSIVKCCLMVDENYKFKAPDIATSPAARYCATQRLVKELRSYPTLKWVLVFGDPGWDALHELSIDGRSIIDVLRDSGLKVVKLPHFAQNFQQREIYSLSEAEAQRVVIEKSDRAKFAPAAIWMRNAVLDAMGAAK